MTTRWSLIQSGAALFAAAALPAPAIAQGADPNVLRVVPQANLTVIDPIWTTAYVTRNGSFMVWDTLFGLDSQYRSQPQMAEGQRYPLIAAFTPLCSAVGKVPRPNPCAQYGLHRLHKALGGT